MGAIGRLFFSKEHDRYFVDDEIGLHCGDVIQILVVDDDGNPKWEQTRIEKSKDWYAVGFNNLNLNGLWAYVFDDDGEGVEYEYTIDPETGPQYEC